MASQGATLQNYNNELVKMLESLKERREDIHSEIVKQEEEKFKIEKEMSILGERLERVNDSMGKNIETREEFDKTIKETESAYLKILESSQTLLHVLKREGASLSKKAGKPSSPSLLPDQQ